MPLIAPFTKQNLKETIYNAFKEQKNVVSGDPLVSYNAISLAIGTAVDQYTLTELYKIKLALQLPGAYTAPGNMSPSTGGPLFASLTLVAAFAQLPDEENVEEEPEIFSEWKENRTIMPPLDKVGLQNEIYKAFSERLTEPPTGDPDLPYRKIAYTMGEGIASYVTNEMNKIKSALLNPGAFTAAAVAVTVSGFVSYEPGVPSPVPPGLP